MRSQPDFRLRADIFGGPEMTLKIGYDQDRFEEAAIVRMLGHFRSLLKGMVAEPAQSLANLPLLADGERQQLLIEWNVTRADYPRHACVPELFEAQVERTPNAVALVYGKEEVSYRELDNQANQVSHHLRSLGLGPDVPVGICLDRSAEMVAGLLGVLKAGGAYVPLDPVNSRERLLFMLKDSGATVLLTQQSLQGWFKSQMRRGRVICLDALPGASGATKPKFRARPTLSPDSL